MVRGQTANVHQAALPAAIVRGDPDLEPMGAGIGDSLDPGFRQPRERIVGALAGGVLRRDRQAEDRGQRQPLPHRVVTASVAAAPSSSR